MNITSYFNFAAGALHTPAKNKQDILTAIAESAVKNEVLKKMDKAAIFKKLSERESIGSTGFGNGIAIPHCSLDNISSFVIGALIAKDGADFRAMDARPVKLFIYIIAPTKYRNEHIRILSEISKVLRNNANVAKLLESANLKGFFDTFTRIGNWDISEELPQEFSQLTVHIQDSAAFSRILELFTEMKSCRISVLEAGNAGKYLYTLPLFSHFMNEERKGFHRVILAIINTVYVNDSVRKILAICEELDCVDKVMVTANMLTYCNGSIDI
ncbi:MAG: PTS sugar transporter subunit IIA [bacterium]|jgi:PTS system nitrogen regulatory IIA component|nr:PTS sugar transporter subunit IIA [bacterium]